MGAVIGGGSGLPPGRPICALAGADAPTSTAAAAINPSVVLRMPPRTGGMMP
jgi:hypothetical protein